jgi:regulator of protease activity HflC (stomatin/prohibitin superfamily)
VAAEFQKVVGAAQLKQSKILAAEAVSVRQLAAADANAFKAIAEAEGERERAEVNAGARAALFTNQMPAFAAAPSYYVQRAYLQTFAKATAPARKYVIVTTNTQDVIQFDLQDKVRADLLDVTVPSN